MIRALLRRSCLHKGGQRKGRLVERWASDGDVCCRGARLPPSSAGLLYDRQRARARRGGAVCVLAGWLGCDFLFPPAVGRAPPTNDQSQFNVCIRIIVFALWLTSRSTVRDIIPLRLSPFSKVFKGKDKASAHHCPQAPRSTVHNLRGSHQQLSSYLYRHSSLFPELSTRAI